MKTKLCGHCKRELPITCFSNSKATKDGLQGGCKQCRQTAWHTRKKDRYELILGAKDAPCCDCGMRYPPVCMDFDHVRGVKITNVAAMIGHPYSKEEILAEIEKCDLVCANCHRIRTFIAREHGARKTDYSDWDEY
jgi:hypothetical protein